MSATPIGGDFTLSARQIQLVRGAINAGIEFATVQDNPITPEFDSTRLPHLESASELLAGALDQLAPEGEFTGRMTPSEMRATRMAVGFVESQLTPPRGAVVQNLSINPTSEEVTALGQALDGLTPATDEDVAYHDWRVGVNVDAILPTVEQVDRPLERIRAASSSVPKGGAAVQTATQAQQTLQLSGRDCNTTTGAVYLLAVAVAESIGTTQATRVIDTGQDMIDQVLNGECVYDDFHRESIRAAWGRVKTAIESGDDLDQTHAAMDLATAWFWNRARAQAATL